MSTRNLERWKKILGIRGFKVGDPIKFKWVDLREKSLRAIGSKKRKTWTYGYVTKELRSSTRDYHWYLVRVVKGGPIREDVNVDLEEAEMWEPRKK